MAVERTPERSFSDLLRTSRAAEATTGWTTGASGVPKWLVSIILRSVCWKERWGSDRNVATRASVFSSAPHAQNMEDHADQQRVAGLFLTVGAALQRAFRIDEDIGDILHIAYLVRPFADFEQRIVPGGTRIGRIEQQAMRELGAPASRQLPVFTLDVVNDGAFGPGQQAVGTTRPPPCCPSASAQTVTHDVFRAGHGADSRIDRTGPETRQRHETIPRWRDLSCDRGPARRAVGRDKLCSAGPAKANR